MTSTQLLPVLIATQTWEISGTSLAILAALETGSMRPKDLARKLGLTEQGVHCAVKRLVARRMVRKTRPSDGDERAVHYALLQYGKLVLENILAGNPAQSAT